MPNPARTDDRLFGLFCDYMVLIRRAHQFEPALWRGLFYQHLSGKRDDMPESMLFWLAQLHNQHHPNLG